MNKGHEGAVIINFNVTTAIEQDVVHFEYSWARFELESIPFAEGQTKISLSRYLK